MARTDEGSSANQVILEAIAKLEAQRDELDVKIDALKAALRAEGTALPPGEVRRGRLSSTARQRISESQKRRWEMRRNLQKLDEDVSKAIGDDAENPLEELAQNAENNGETH